MKNLRPFFRAAAFSGWFLGTSSIFYKAQFVFLGLEPVKYSALVILPGVLGIALGVLYWDISEKPAHRLELLKIGLFAKGGSSIIWIIGLITGDLPSIFWAYAIWADLFWIPGFIYYYFKLLCSGDKSK